MKTVYFVTRLRGFFKQLINCNNVKVRFLYNDSQIYETNSWVTKCKNRIGRSKLLDVLGVIQIIKDNSNNSDIIGSFNRFVNTRKSYFIYVENPTALYHYRLSRGKSLLGKKTIQKELNKPNLKALIFMSKACESTFEQVCGKIAPTCFAATIYPLIPENPYVSSDSIKKRSLELDFDLLYIAQGVRFESKGGLEVVRAFELLRDNGFKINLHIITSLKDISESTKSYICNKSGIVVDDFKFSFSELQHIYASSHLLLQPTSDESFGLTILEAMKSGLPVIASKMYSIPELITDNWNGYLCNPHYWFFNQQNIPNPEVWNNRKSTIYSGSIDESIIGFLVEKISFLYNHRDVLTKMSLNSLNRACTPPFAEKYIADQWNNLFNIIIN